jgi:hypothetical protein
MSGTSVTSEVANVTLEVSTNPDDALRAIVILADNRGIQLLNTITFEGEAAVVSVGVTSRKDAEVLASAAIQLPCVVAAIGG